MKTIRITDAGFVWEIPTLTIADHRARYYAKRDKDTTYADEIKFAMGDDFELRDWFLNNMNWEDVKDNAQRVIVPDLLSPRLTESNCKIEVVNR